MGFVQELSLLVAIAAPVATIASINLSLHFAGERGTLLMPELGEFPAVDAWRRGALPARARVYPLKHALRRFRMAAPRGAQ